MIKLSELVIGLMLAHFLVVAFMPSDRVDLTWRVGDTSPVRIEPSTSKPAALPGAYYVSNGIRGPGAWTTSFTITACTLQACHATR